MCYFFGCLFQAENKFWGVIFGRITNRHKCWRVIFGKTTFKDIKFDQISHTWLKFRVVVTILGYTAEWLVNFEISFSQKLFNFRV